MRQTNLDFITNGGVARKFLIGAAAGAAAAWGMGTVAKRVNKTPVRKMPRSATPVKSVKTLPKASIGETLAFFLDVMIPNVAKGMLIRRPKMVAFAERMGLDERAVRRMQALRDKHQPGPLLLRLPMRSQALILSPEHVRRVLEGSPEPFATASSEKRAALAHFEPKVALASHGPERAVRREINEQALDSQQPVHRLAESFLEVVRSEANRLLADVRRHGELSWDEFAPVWFRLVRRVTFGNGAADDQELTDMLAELRSNANWAFLKPKQKGLQKRFFQRLHEQLARGESGSLASFMAPKLRAGDDALHQVPQWLFAFDPAGMTTFRALALLAAHPEHADKAREEIANAGTDRQHLPYLRATVLESLRLWPTAPAILRQSTQDTHWESGVMPAETSILIYAPFFHRDDRRLPFANRFAPELWLDNRPTGNWALVPFSDGPAVCPGRNLVLLLTSAMLAELLGDRQIRLLPYNRLDASQPLPGALNNYSLRFELLD